MSLAVPREVTYAHVSHPEHLGFRHGRDVLSMYLVDDVFTETVTKGDSVLGWEGDPRLAVYMAMPQPACPEASYWVVRLCADGTYQTILRAAAVIKGPEIMAGFVRRLVEIDGRRGFDPIASLDKAEERARKAQDDQIADAAGDVADRLAFAARKDGLLDFCTGV